MGDVEDAKTRYAKYMDGPPNAPREDKQNAQWLPKDPSDYNKLNPSKRCDLGKDYPSNPMYTQVKKEYPRLYSPDGSCCVGGGTCVAPDAPNQDQRWVFPSPQGLSPAPPPPPNMPPPPTGATSTNGFYTVKLKLPTDVTPDLCTKEDPCTLQWIYMTGNSQDAYPEAFRSCSDFALTSGAATSRLWGGESLKRLVDENGKFTNSATAAVVGGLVFSTLLFGAVFGLWRRTRGSSSTSSISSDEETDRHENQAQD